MGKGGANTNQQLEDVNFYTGLIWDFNTVWKIPTDGLQVLMNITIE